MNSMHNSFSGPGGYSGAYPGYVPPPSALPYYNGYPGDVNQSNNPYYAKPGSSLPPGYSSGMGTYTPPINNSSMYYQQYGLGYQYGYGKYGINSTLGYSSEIPSGSGIHPPIGTLQAPTTDLGLTGSMFSKNSKYSGNQGSSSPHTSGISHGSNMLSPATPNTPSPGPHVIASNIRGPGATPSPPVECNEGKKDLEKMKRCQICGQIFRLMSECLAHMKTVHEAPLSVYGLHHAAGGHVTQSLNSATGMPPHSLAGGISPSNSRHTSMTTPDSPLMALERMGWGEKQTLMPSLQSSSPLAAPTPFSSTANPQHPHHQSSSNTQPQTASQIYGSASHQHSLPVQHQSRILRSPVQHHSPSSHSSPVQHPSPAPQMVNASQHLGGNQNIGSPVVGNLSSSDLNASHSSSQIDIQQNSCDDVNSAAKQRKPNSYSVSSIIGESNDVDGVNNKINLNNSHSTEKHLEHIVKGTERKNESYNLPPNYGKAPRELDGKISKSLLKTEQIKKNQDTTNISHLQTAVTIGLSQAIHEKNYNFDDRDQEGLDHINDQESIEDSKSPQSTLLQCEEDMLKSGDDDKPTPHNGQDIATDRVAKKEFNSPSTLIVGKKDLIREMQASGLSQQNELNYLSNIKKEEGSDTSASVFSTNALKDQDSTSYNKEADEASKFEIRSATAKDDFIKSEIKCSDSQVLIPDEASTSKQSNQLLVSQADQHHVHSSQQQESHGSPSGTQPLTPLPHHLSSVPLQPQHHRHSSPPIGMYHNQTSMKGQAGYGGWPMPLGPNYSSQYPYSCPQNGSSQTGVGSQQQSSSSLPGNICSKPHGYTMHPRFASQYHQAGGPGGQYPPAHDHVRVPGPHTYMQSHAQNLPAGHPQNSWYPPRSESKAMWGSWGNQSGQSYHQGYYGYPNSNQAPGQKHLHQSHTAPPPAHVHPQPQGQPASHLQSLPHQHPMSMSQKSQMLLHCSSTPPQTATAAVQSSIHSQQSGTYPVSPHDNLKESNQIAFSVSSPAYHAITSSESSPQPLDQQPLNEQLCLQNEKEATKFEPNSNGSLPSEMSDNQITNTTLPLGSAANVPTNENYIQGVVSLKKSNHKIGPKSKIMSGKQINQLDEMDNYKCTITVQENGSLNGYTSQESSGTGGPLSCDSSDSEVAVDEGPIFTMLKPAKRKFRNAGRDGIFVGPKRIKLAKQVWERQERRQRSIQEQIRQSEIEEQLQAERIELADGQTGPLANILLQSSILLSDKKVEESDSVEECIANIKAENQPFHETTYDIDGHKTIFFGGSCINSANKKPGRRNQSKVFHNEHSVRIQDRVMHHLYMRKLRAKDFKWSHYIKSMRYWCSDCAHGFKNNKEVSMHNEERCKWNCLYMLECYVYVKDIQTHPAYGPKVQELLEEYQIDGQHQCVTCTEIIARKADFLVHVDSHKDFMPWECTICGTRFKIRGSLKEHLRYTHMKGRVPCLKCNKVFPTSTLLRQHVKVHTQHYKYKSTKNREEELRAAMEATAGALEVPMGTTSPEDNEKLSNEANEYRNWCKLMEMNAMKNLSTPGTMGGSSAGGSIGDEDEDDGRDVDGSGDEGLGENSFSESPRHCGMNRSFSETKADMSS